MNPIALATQAKGRPALLRRAHAIVRRYGLTPAKMTHALDLFAHILSRFDCDASFALTAVVFRRHTRAIAGYLGRNIHFLVHGYTHVDYSHLSPARQVSHLRRARQLFRAQGVDVTGFRAPYLHKNDALYAALESTGFLYGSSQAILWRIWEPGPSSSVYDKAVAFYAPWMAAERPSLPHFRGRIVEIPVSLPDDEMLLDRLAGDTAALPTRVWLAVLEETYRRGELFTLQLHPERIAWGREGLVAVLSDALSRQPAVWVANLGEVAAWWRARTAAEVRVESLGKGVYRFTVAGPPGTVFLARAVEVLSPSTAWGDGYRLVRGPTCTVRSARKPVIAAPPTAPAALLSFLRQQGYIVQTGPVGDGSSVRLDRPHFAPQDERPLLAHIEKKDVPLVRLARWPDGARSALSISGDIDALTVLDYGLRLCGC